MTTTQRKQFILEIKRLRQSGKSWKEIGSIFKLKNPSSTYLYHKSKIDCQK